MLLILFLILYLFLNILKITTLIIQKMKRYFKLWTEGEKTLYPILADAKIKLTHERLQCLPMD